MPQGGEELLLATEKSLTGFRRNKRSPPPQRAIVFSEYATRDVKGGRVARGGSSQLGWQRKVLFDQGSIFGDQLQHPRLPVIAVPL